jgi:hypothetical protein
MEADYALKPGIPPSERRRRVAFDLAWRLIKNGARTSTIIRWTGLTEKRIQWQRQQRHEERRSVELKKRPGRPPHLINFLLKSPDRRRAAEQLARRIFDVHAFPDVQLSDTPSFELGMKRIARLCDIFESFEAEFPTSDISIEQADNLRIALERREEVELRVCVRCAGPVLATFGAKGSQHCSKCEDGTM